MSVLVVSPRYAPHPGGIEKLLAQVLPELRAEGFDVVVATGTNDGLAAADTVGGVPVYRLPFLQAIESGRAGEILRVAAQLRDVERAHRVEVRHVQGFGDIGLWYVLRDHQRTPKPLAVSVHGTLEPVGPIGTTALAVLRVADVVSAVSEAVAASVATMVPDCAGRVQLIRNGLRADDEPPRPWRSRGHLLAVGRLDDQKGFDVAVDALARMQPGHSDVELVIVGRGRQRGALRERAERAGVTARVRIIEQLSADEIASVMDAASVVLVPSRTMEGFSLVALEAAHAGRPVIASRVGGLPETVEDGVTGIIVAPDDPVALAAAVDRLLDSPNVARSMGQAGRRRALARYDLSQCVAGYGDLYRDLYARVRPGQNLEPASSSA